ncbi:hypothetical protein [Pseudoduganella sp. HUAS MS19]
MLIAYEILVPVLAGLATSFYLRNALRNLLLDLCGTAPRAEFWVRTSTLLITAFPILLTLWFGRSDVEGATPVLVLRTALIMSVTGVVAGVAVMGWNIAKSIPKPGK